MPSIEKEGGWDEWRNKHLKFVKEHLKEGTSFDFFCSGLKELLDDFELRDKAVLKEEEGRKKTDRQKEVGRHLEQLHKALNTARDRELFKGHAPDFFISLLMLCCETEYNQKYVKGSQEHSQQRAEFIAGVANLLFECTGHVFDYNSKADLLCKTVAECLEGISQMISPTAVRDQIHTYILVRASAKIDPTADVEGSTLVAYRNFSYKELKYTGRTPKNLPDNFTFESAVATHNPVKIAYTRKAGFRDSYLAGHFIFDTYPFMKDLTPEELLHPNISCWFHYLMLRCLQERNNRAKCVVERFRQLTEAPPKRIEHTTPCCTGLVDMFKKDGECYSPDVNAG